LSPGKSPTKIRTWNIQQTALEAKLIVQTKQKSSNSAASGYSSPVLPDPSEKLPDISPKRKNS